MLTALGWICVELRARNVLETILGKAACARVKPSFEKSRRLSRFIPVAVYFFSWWITAFIFRLVLWTRGGPAPRLF